MNILQSSYTAKYSTKTKRAVTIIALFLLLLVAFFIALSSGASDSSLLGALTALTSGDKSSTDLQIILYVRLPRVLGAMLAGAALAVSGIVVQAVLQNPMAAPNLIGVNAGAGFFVIIAMAILPKFIGYIPLAAFLGALAAALLIYSISAFTGAGRVSITLVGIAVGSILTAGINTVKVIFPDSIYDVSGFLIGGLSSADINSVLPAAIMIIPALLLTIIFSRTLDALSLGSSVAKSIGINVTRSRLLWLTLAAILAGAAVSFSGLIGFVGLIVPHIMRRLVGGNHRYLIPTSILGGALFLLITDTLARTLFAPYELPVGILLSLIGGPFFIFLILTDRRTGR